MESTTDVEMTTPGLLRVLRDLLLDLGQAVDKGERYRRLVQAIQKLFAADAVTLLRRREDALFPIASIGLAPDTEGHRFEIAENPRFAAICSARGAVQFPSNSTLPDPFDGLLDGVAGVDGFTSQVHACLGMPLMIDGRVEGVLTLDAIAPRAFEAYPLIQFELVAAIAVATLRNTDLVDAIDLGKQRKVAIGDSLLRRDLENAAGRMVGRSPSILNLQEEIALFAGSEFPVLIGGETGTGKELVVRRLHRESSRAEKPLIYVNCAALPESVVESELFGHETGSFTGATQRRLGKFQVADGGCLFLDEIGELPLSVQPKLLRVLQSGEIQRVGSDKSHQVSVRVFAATNRELEKEVEAGRFRSDLLHRLDVCRITVPPLRTRHGDIPVLAGQFCDSARRQLGFGPIRLHPEALVGLEAYAWPGNVRELENVISRAVLRASTRVLRGNLILVQARDLGAEFCKKDSLGASLQEVVSEPVIETTVPPMERDQKPLREAVEDYQRQLIEASLAANDGVWAAAARDLGMHRSNLHHLSARLGLREA
ncbi:MAG: nitric oxide reductase transcriptional regulator NorR [Planctomycetota bacterium]